jgi:hypothetical protein
VRPRGSKGDIADSTASPLASLGEIDRDGFALEITSLLAPNASLLGRRRSIRLGLDASAAAGKWSRRFCIHESAGSMAQKPIRPKILQTVQSPAIPFPPRTVAGIRRNMNTSANCKRFSVWIEPQLEQAILVRHSTWQRVNAYSTS